MSAREWVCECSGVGGWFGVSTVVFHAFVGVQEDIDALNVQPYGVGVLYRCRRDVFRGSAVYYPIF